MFEVDKLVQDAMNELLSPVARRCRTCGGPGPSTTVGSPVYGLCGGCALRKALSDSKEVK